jgi:hypothetical protein
LGNGGPFKYDHAPTHFLDIERSEAEPLCATEGDAVSDDLTTVLVERITCENCRGAINRHLAKNDNSLAEVNKHEASLTTRLAVLPGNTSVSRGGGGRGRGAQAKQQK